MIIEGVKYYPLPQPDEISIREKEDAMGAYFMMFASLAAGLPLPLINLIAALIYYYLNKAKSKFVQFHALQSLLSQIPVSLLNAGAVIWGISILFDYAEYNDIFKGYLIMTIVINVVYVLFSIIAAVKARKGLFYYFIFFGRFSYHNVFKIKEGDKDNQKIVNLPPKM